MKKIKICILLLLAFFCMACREEEKCDEPITYRPEIGVGYVFRETDSGCYPVANAVVTVDNVDWRPGLGGWNRTLVTESYKTDAEGCYQVRFVKKICTVYVNGTKDYRYCNLYGFYYDNKNVFGFTEKKIDNNAQNNILILDTITIKKIEKVVRK